MSPELEVALVLDHNFGDKIVDLAKFHVVWVISSPINDAAALKARHAYPGRVTILRNREGEHQTQTFVRAVYDIDDHHGELSQSGPYQSLTVFGFSLDMVPTEVVAELGFKSAEITEFGFRATKAT